MSLKNQLLRNKLNRLKTHLNLENDKKSLPMTNVPNINNGHDIPYLQKWEDMGGKAFVFEDEYIFVREVEYPLTYQHGRYCLGELRDIVASWNETMSNHPLSAKGRKAEDLLFFDTETTGLGHGTGNTIFLLGCSQFTKDKVIVRQYFLPGPEAEVAFYQGFLGDVKDLKNLVTYNGKAFDWPQVKTRHTLIRDLLPKLPAFGHYDLLHGARRLWKDVLESCRLSVVEDQLLEIKRTSDTPGYLAPMLYFDYLREKDPEIIKGVLIHNEIDVLSLITLYIHVSKMLLKQYSQPLSANELYAIGKWYEYIGEEEQAEDFYLQALKGAGPLQLRVKMSLGGLYKKQKRMDEAVAIWTQLEEEASLVNSDIFIELSKAYEHQYKDYGKALYYAEKAWEIWKRDQRLLHVGRDGAKQLFVKRLERLENKLLKQAK